jgi:hypothetical protein
VCALISLRFAICISQIFVTRDCEYNVIASKETLKTLELERQRAIKQQQLEEAGNVTIISMLNFHSVERI